MRPTDKGPRPRIYRRYADARFDLETRIGGYCSYCEKNLDNSPDVEHVIPKSLEPDHLLDWENFLLGCKNCNQIKSKKPVDRTAVAFPDTDNTFLALKYDRSRVTVSADLSDAHQDATRLLVELVGLHRHPDDPDNPPTKLDNRWKLREEEWLVAQQVKDTLDAFDGDTENLRALAVLRPKAKGLFSVWMSVFHNDFQMRKLLLSAFPGTAKCFDEQGNPIPREGGKF